MIRLSKRLSMNASFVTPGNRLADVGTDHGYIPIALVQEKIIPSALAMDVNPGPLERAKQHIREFHLESDIHTRLSDGVQSLQPGEADSVLIAGMGGALTVKILQEGREVLRTVKELILQPQSEIDKVRRYLEQAGYKITKEDMVWEEGKYYQVMKAEAGEMHYDCENFYHYGKLLLESGHPVLRKNLTQRRALCEQLLKKLDQEGRIEERTQARLQEIKEEIQRIDTALRAYYDEM
ncbi:MAG: tRNA (adenine(22)-N(1))-methyltransferase [Ruminococcus sp.]